MHTFCKSLLVLGLLAGAAGSVQAAEKAKKAKKDPTAASFNLPAAITLTDEQRTKLDEVKKEYSPKVSELLDKKNGILTADQKKARAEAVKAAKAEGKKGKDLMAAGEEAMKLSDDQKEQMAAVDKDLKALNKEIRGKITEFLTDEQKAALKKPKKAA
ncbi:MAG TPA: hypothetical protein VHB77_05960 [Planctomycetaceae bacterium]|nr:hypothetical protein [Planctomycetaceae bacterium]